jgi:transcriptional regulator with XRE-family HTH domain
VKSTLTIAAAPTPATSFRLYLQSELARRCTRNAQYSLRAFAMHLGVDHSTLSQWLRGRRPITARSIEALGAALGLAADVVDGYVKRAAREPDAGPPGEAGILTPETVALIADWYHFAILELTRLAEFRPDSRWIARVLGVSVDEVNVALQRLIRLDLLEMASTERWVDRSGDARVSLEALEPAAVERLHDQARGRSAAALRGVSVTLREHTSITLAVNSAMLPRAFELAARFRQQLVELLQQGPADDVYQLEISLFPLTTIKHTGRETHGMSGDAVADPGQGS